MADGDQKYYVAQIPLTQQELASHFFAKTIEIQAELDTVRSLLCQIIAEIKQLDPAEVESMAQSIQASHSMRRLEREIPEIQHEVSQAPDRSDAE